MIPDKVKHILRTLHDNNFEAFIVGGAVRDTILCRTINDWDITTNALPDDVERLFDRTNDIGKKFGTIQIMDGTDAFEVTTYRLDSATGDGRKPDHVTFSREVIEDLKRRDFTMNAMIMDEFGRITDYFNGQNDLSAHQLKTVGMTKTRFDEDYLRVYRYVRFTAQLGFTRNSSIDEVVQSMPINTNISFERIQVELNKILLSKSPSCGIRHLKELGLLSYICPGIEKSYNFDQHCQYHHKDVFEHTMLVLDEIPDVLSYRLAALLHDIGKPDTFELIEGQGHFYKHDKRSVELTEIILKRLKYSNEVISEVLTLITHHMRLLDVENTKSLKKFIRKIGFENLNGYIALRKADILGCKTQGTLEEVKQLEEVLSQILNETPPLSIRDINISGYDLMGLGLKGKDIGDMNKYLLDLIDEDPALNESNILIGIVKDFLKSRDN